MDRINPNLLKKYAEGTASEEECQKVEQWLEQEDNLFEDEIQPEKEDEYTSTYPISALWRSFMRQTDAGLRYIRLWWWGTRVALPMILLAVGITVYRIQPDRMSVTNAETWATLEVPKGQQANLKLSDSTVVYLSGGSKLVYPKQFESNERRISLEYGHAFLEVAKDKKRPFLLQSDRTQIKVLGTALDVSNRIDDGNIAVILKEGAVEFSNHSGLIRTMKPGDKLVYNKSNAQVQMFEHMDVSTMGQWTTGSLQFKQVHLEDVLGLLEDRYNVVFQWQHKAFGTIPVTGKFDNIPLKRILFLLGESTGLRFEENNKVITIKR